MEAPSLITPEERRIIAREIALKYHAFASTIHIVFHKQVIHVMILAEKEFKVPDGTHTVVIEREDF